MQVQSSPNPIRDPDLGFQLAFRHLDVPNQSVPLNQNFRAKNYHVFYWDTEDKIKSSILRILNRLLLRAFSVHISQPAGGPPPPTQPDKYGLTTNSATA